MPTQEVLLGAFEEQVLLAVARCGGDAFGMNVRREIEARTGRSVAIGAVFATLDRLEVKEFLACRVADPLEERRGRPRKYFRLLPGGAQALARAHDLHRRMWQGVDPEGLGAEIE